MEQLSDQCGGVQWDGVGCDDLEPMQIHLWNILPALRYPWLWAMTDPDEDFLEGPPWSMMLLRALCESVVLMVLKWTGAF